jgi:hypothetical protein
MPIGAEHPCYYGVVLSINVNALWTYRGHAAGQSSSMLMTDRRGEGPRLISAHLGRLHHHPVLDSPQPVFFTGTRATVIRLTDRALSLHCVIGRAEIAIEVSPDLATVSVGCNAFSGPTAASCW